MLVFNVVHTRHSLDNHFRVNNISQNVLVCIHYVVLIHSLLCSLSDEVIADLNVQCSLVMLIS